MDLEKLCSTSSWNEYFYVSIQVPPPDCEVACRGEPDAEAALGLPKVG